MGWYSRETCIWGPGGADKSAAVMTTLGYCSLFLITLLPGAESHVHFWFTPRSSHEADPYQTQVYSCFRKILSSPPNRYREFRQDRKSADEDRHRERNWSERGDSITRNLRSSAYTVLQEWLRHLYLPRKEDPYLCCHCRSRSLCRHVRSWAAKQCVPHELAGPQASRWRW